MPINMVDLLKELEGRKNEFLDDIKNESIYDSVIPIVLMVDRSGSMGSGNPAPIDTVNDALASFKGELANPTLPAFKNHQHRLWLTVISYGDCVTIDLPFTNVVNLPAIPSFVANGNNLIEQAIETVKKELSNFYNVVCSSCSSYSFWHQAIIIHMTDGLLIDENKSTLLSLNLSDITALYNFIDHVSCDKNMIKSIEGDFGKGTIFYLENNLKIFADIIDITDRANKITREYPVLNIFYDH